MLIFTILEIETRNFLNQKLFSFFVNVQLTQDQEYLKYTGVRVLHGLFCPWSSPGKNTGVGRHLLLQGIFLTQGVNLRFFCLLHWQADFRPLAPPGEGNGNPVFLPGESQGWRSLMGCPLWGHTELDTTETTQQQQQHHLGSPELP